MITTPKPSGEPATGQRPATDHPADQPPWTSHLADDAVGNVIDQGSTAAVLVVSIADAGLAHRLHRCGPAGRNHPW